MPEPRQDNRYQETDPNDQQTALQSKDDFRLVQDSPGKKSIDPRTTSNDEGDFLFENNVNNNRETSVKDKLRYNNDAADPSEQSRYFKQYYNTMQSENRGNYANARINLSRDRRQAQKNNPEERDFSGSKLNEETKNSAPEDEEAAIKKHVKKLTGEELQELISSLSEDKRELLKKIMESDTDSDSDSINKREITKKAGAVEENSFMENGQSDASKLQSGGGETNAENSRNSAQETSKQPDANDVTITKTLDISNSSTSPANKPESTAHVDEQNQGKPESSLNSGSSSAECKNDANVDSTTKTENKREANFDNMSDIQMSFDDTKFENDLSIKDSPGPLNDETYICSQNEGMSQLNDGESNGNRNFKREAILESESDFSDSIKSLEESFPNSNSYDESDPYSGSDMAPLVRVKRKNEDVAIKKRAAALLPDAKVAFFPHRAENDDEDNDEGNEFDDEGFYDRTASLAKNNDKPGEETLNFDTSKHFTDRNPPSSLSNDSKFSNENILESETMSLGSDTDNVLSGVDGVDDNLMFNSGARSRRTAEDNKEQPVNAADIKYNRELRSTPFIDDEFKSVSENNINVPNYQENDAFGPLPRNYEGELGRYKRIRRVKQPSATADVTSVDTA